MPTRFTSPNGVDYFMQDDGRVMLAEDPALKAAQQAHLEANATPEARARNMQQFVASRSNAPPTELPLLAPDRMGIPRPVNDISARAEYHTPWRGRPSDAPVLSQDNENEREEQRRWRGRNATADLRRQAFERWLKTDAGKKYR